MDARTKNELLAVCNSLGYIDEESKKYVKDPECINCLLECLRFLRRENEEFLIRRELGKTNIVVNDILPLMKQHCVNDKRLFDICVRLLMNLTNPVILLYKERLPTEKENKQIFIELMSYLFVYKEAFAFDLKFFSLLAKFIGEIIKKDWQERQEEEKILLERILILIRNILHIPIDETIDENCVDTDNVHDHCLTSMFNSGLTDLIIYMLKTDEHEYGFHLIEIISLMYKEQNASNLATSVAYNGNENDLETDDILNELRLHKQIERERTSKQFKEFYDKEKLFKHKQKNDLYYKNRMKEATFIVKGLKSISDNDLICHRMPTDVNTINTQFDKNKKRIRKAKNRVQLKDESINICTLQGDCKHRSSYKVRLNLVKFAYTIINDCYNPLMKTLRSNLERKQTQLNDETYFLWSMQFFMEFTRIAKNISIKRVLYTLSIDSFHFLHKLIEHYKDNLSTEKKEFYVWSRRLHYALKAYREFLYSLTYLEQYKGDSDDVNISLLSKDDDDNADNDRNVSRQRKFNYDNVDYRQLSNEIKLNVFYEIEYRELLLNLLYAYQPTKLSIYYLKELIETNHIYLKMLEYYCKKNDNLIVKEKLRKKRKRNKKSKNNDDNEVEQKSVEIIWSEIISEISAALQANENEKLSKVDEDDVDVIPFDGTSEKSFDEQKLIILQRVHDFLREKRCITAITLYRNARNAWIDIDEESEAFGSKDVTAEQEMINLREILFNEFLSEKYLLEKKKTSEANNEDEDNDDYNNADDEAAAIRTSEREFSFEKFFNKYISTNIIITYTLLLNKFEQNNSMINHCIVRFFHRIAWDCKLPAIFFQLSIFMIFHRLFNLKCQRLTDDLNELDRFAKYILHHFYLCSLNNDKLVVELLFWKSKREAIEIHDGYSKEVVKRGEDGESNDKKKGKRKGRRKQTSDDERLDDEIIRQFDASDDDDDDITSHNDNNEKQEKNQQENVSTVDDDDDDEAAKIFIEWEKERLKKLVTSDNNDVDIEINEDESTKSFSELKESINDSINSDLNDFINDKDDIDNEKIKKRKRVKVMDSDDEKEDEIVNESVNANKNFNMRSFIDDHNDEKNDNEESKKRKRVKVIDSDEEVEDETVDVNDKFEPHLFTNDEKVKNDRNSDADEKSRKRKRVKVIDSDEEEDYQNNADNHEKEKVIESIDTNDDVNMPFSINDEQIENTQNDDTNEKSSKRKRVKIIDSDEEEDQKHNDERVYPSDNEEEKVNLRSFINSDDDDDEKNGQINKLSKRNRVRLMISDDEDEVADKNTSDREKSNDFIDSLALKVLKNIKTDQLSRFQK